MTELHTLKKTVQRSKRVGRGGARGGTSGRGHKGQKARSGSGNKIRPGFEGGQMPLYRRLPKRGFNNVRFSVPVKIVNVGRLESCFEAGQEITKEALVLAGLITVRSCEQNFVLKILGSGELTKKFIIHADRASKTAIDAVQSAGGDLIITEKR